MMTATSIVEAAWPAVRPPLWRVLVRHEWRLVVRGFWPGRHKTDASPPAPRPMRTIGLVAVAIVLLHLLGAITIALPARWSDDPPHRLGAVTVALFLFTFMLSTAMTRVIAAFHERRDLDLLLASPVSANAILAVRATTVAIAVTLLFATFVYPIVNVGVLTGHAWMARLYPLVPLTAFLATAVALALTDLVVKMLGLRRARTGLQVFSALVGASMYLASQARQFVPHDTATRWMQRYVDLAGSDDAAWPFRSVARLADGDAWAWLAFALVAVASFAMAVHRARTRFVDVARESDAGPVTRPATRDQVARRVARAFRRRAMTAMLVKEWTLTARSPQLLAQILLQVLYLVPLLFVAFAREGPTASWSGAAFAAAIAGLAGTLATSLAWLSIAAEDAPDLVVASPQPRSTILVAKLLAATVPPFVLVSVAAAGRAGHSVTDAAIVWTFGTLACASAAIVAASVRVTGRRSDFQKRYQGRGLAAVVEGLQFLLWAAAAGTASAGAWMAAGPLAFLACLLPAFRLRAALANVGASS